MSGAGRYRKARARPGRATRSQHVSDKQAASLANPEPWLVPWLALDAIAFLWSVKCNVRAQNRNIILKRKGELLPSLTASDMNSGTPVMIIKTTPSSVQGARYPASCETD